MKIAIVHNEPCDPSQDTYLSSADVLQATEAVERAVEALRHEAVVVGVGVGANAGPALAELASAEPDVVVNLVEATAGVPDSEAAFAGQLEMLGIPFTGSPAHALQLTTDKALAKRILRENGLPTSAFFVYRGEEPVPAPLIAFPVIAKPLYEDASIGIDERCFIESEKRLHDVLPSLHRELTQPILVEEFLTGREFNISVFGYPEPRVLPIAEIDFSAFPEGSPRIVSYNAKWVEDSAEYRGTPRAIPAKVDAALGATLRGLARDCFRLFGCRDYARVDCRLDAGGRPYILEVNANPCITPDAGFCAALQAGEMTYEEFISELIRFAATRSAGRGRCSAAGGGRRS